MKHCFVNEICKFKLKLKKRLQKSKVVHSQTFLKCRDHDDTKAWNITNANCSNCILLQFVKEFPNGKLPLCIDVLSLILDERKVNRGKSIGWQDIAINLVLH